MLRSLWRSYKHFCDTMEIKKWLKPPALWEVLLVFPIIIHALIVFIPCMMWFTGTVLYFYAGFIVICVQIAWWLLKWIIRLLVFLVRCIIAKVQHTPYPSFPWPVKRSASGMSGEQFERYVAKQLGARGYHNIQFTPATGDYGVDILATKHGRVYAFQCKCYTGSVGVSAVQEVYSGSRKYHADRAVVITNSKYTPNAKTLAHDLGVSLWDLEVLNSIFCE